VGQFVRWYNQEHRHSAIRFVTPHERHEGLEDELLLRRVDVYEAAKKAAPNRWSGPTRNWAPIKAVHLNPDQSSAEKTHRRAECKEHKKAA